MGFVTATVRGLTGGIGPVGGHAQIGNVELFDGRIRGTPTPNDRCESPLDAKNWTGFGVSFSAVTGSVEYPNCDPCELSPGDRIEITRGTFLIVTFSKMTFHIAKCGTKSADLSIDFFKSLGIEVSTATWVI